MLKKFFEDHIEKICLYATAIFIFLFFWDLSLRSAKGDAHFWRHYGELFYHAIYYFKEIPHFSFFYNGGTPLIADPQNPIYSVWSLWTLIFGPISGTRFGVAFLSLAGFLCCYYWLRTKTSRLCAIAGAAAWILSSGFFWRTIANHYVFLWHSLLPVFFLIIDRLHLKDKKTFIRITWAGLFLGMILLANSYQSLVYLFIPASLIWFFIQLYFGYYSGKLKIVFTHASLIIASGVFLAAPRLMAFANSQMAREVVGDGTISLKDSLYHLVQTARTGEMGVKLIGTDPQLWSFIWEVSSALMPSFTILALIGALSLWLPLMIQREEPFKLYLFAVILVLIGVGLSSQPWLWASLKGVIGDSIRNPSRFLALSAFGLTLFGTLALTNHFSKGKNPFPKLFPVLILISILFLASEWRLRAYRENTLMHTRQNAIEHPDITIEMPKVPLFTVDFVDNQAFRKGKILIDAYNVNGSGYHDNDIHSNWQRYYPKKGDKTVRYGDQPITDPNGPYSIKLGHKWFAVENLQVNDSLTLKLQPSLFGHEIEIIGSGTVELERGFYEFKIENVGKKSVKKVIIHPKLPTPTWAWWISILTFLSLVGFLVRQLAIYKKTS